MESTAYLAHLSGIRKLSQSITCELFARLLWRIYNKRKQALILRLLSCGVFALSLTSRGYIEMVTVLHEGISREVAAETSGTADA